VAALETYLKTVVASLVDHGPVYLERGTKLIGDRSLKVQDALTVIQSGTASPGQLIAHLLPCSAVSHLEDPLDTVLGFSVKHYMKTAVGRWGVTLPGENPSPVVGDVSRLWQSLAELFERRHILAHEAAPGYVVTSDDARESIDAVDQFMQGLDAILWTTIWADEPLTHREMTDKAWKDFGVNIASSSCLSLMLRFVGRSLSLAHFVNNCTV
jgi:hypothetical protein